MEVERDFVICRNSPQPVVVGVVQRLRPSCVGRYRWEEGSPAQVVRLNPLEIFDRINRGTRVTASQKVLARLSAMHPGIVGEVEAYLETSEESHGGDFDLDFFIGCLALVAREFVNIELLPDH